MPEGLNSYVLVVVVVVVLVGRGWLLLLLLLLRLVRLLKFNVAPKSTRTALFPGVSQRMFSGLTSSWTRRRAWRWARALAIWWWIRDASVGSAGEGEGEAEAEAALARVHRAWSSMRVSRLAPGSRRRVSVREVGVAEEVRREVMFFCFGGRGGRGGQCQLSV